MLEVTSTLVTDIGKGVPVCPVDVALAKPSKIDTHVIEGVAQAACEGLNSGLGKGDVLKVQAKSAQGLGG